VSTNPWKVTATFQTISSTREEYIATIESLKKASSSSGKPGEKRPKTEANHLELIKLLEDRLENIDAELAVSPPTSKNIVPCGLRLLNTLVLYELLTSLIARAKGPQEDRAARRTLCTS
jgi:hypothetical protein